MRGLPLFLCTGVAAFLPPRLPRQRAVVVRGTQIAIDTETQRQQALYDLIYVERLPEENMLPETGLVLPTDVCGARIPGIRKPHPRFYRKTQIASISRVLSPSAQAVKVRAALSQRMSASNRATSCIAGCV